MADTIVYLVRHGMHDWLRPETDRFAGTLPGIGLNAQGEEEATRLAAVLREVPLAWVVSSPLQRALETAELIVADRDLPVTTDARLIEWRCGPWEGLTIPEIQARYPEAWQIWHTDPTHLHLPGAEPLEEVADRMDAVFREWVARGGAGLFVSHRDPLAALLCRLLGMPLARIRALDLPTGSLSACRQTSYGVIVDAINLTASVS